MIDYSGAVQEFYAELLSSLTSRVKLHSSNFVLQGHRRSHGCNASREGNTKIGVGGLGNWK